MSHGILVDTSIQIGYSMERLREYADHFQDNNNVITISAPYFNPPYTFESVGPCSSLSNDAVIYQHKDESTLTINTSNSKLVDLRQTKFNGGVRTPIKNSIIMFNKQRIGGKILYQGAIPILYPTKETEDLKYCSVEFADFETFAKSIIAPSYKSQTIELILSDRWSSKGQMRRKFARTDSNKVDNFLERLGQIFDEKFQGRPIEMVFHKMKKFIYDATGSEDLSHSAMSLTNETADKRRFIEAIRGALKKDRYINELKHIENGP